MQKSILIGALLLMGATQTYAAQPKDKGYYFGGVVGFSNFNDDGLGNIYDADLSGQSGAFGVSGGYKFLKYLSVEGRFTYLGDAGQTLAYKPTALTANVVGILPLGTSGVELYGQAGLGGLFINEDLSSVGIDGSDNPFVGTAGAGIRVYATEMVAISAEYAWYGWEQKDNGQKYDFTSDTLLFGLQWMF